MVWALRFSDPQVATWHPILLIMRAVAWTQILASSESQSPSTAFNQRSRARHTSTHPTVYDVVSDLQQGSS